ncbi:uncharacterized protein LOC128954187 [Oppia nitens]|uniref:uncharacterized protein LOC128954187 n=1 Tax=Oppia nitens TaxID=1686743 RepID=UPI0023DA6242|nr:uncharacterized protein LOC128954187 [Oppia nitens]
MCYNQITKSLLLTVSPLLLLVTTFVIIGDTAAISVRAATDAAYCNPKLPIKQSLNLDRYVFMGQGLKSTGYYQFDGSGSRGSSRLWPVAGGKQKKFDIDSLFGKNSFNWLDTAFSFTFPDDGDCGRAGSNSDPAYCPAIRRARDLVVVIGRRHGIIDGHRAYGYMTYRVTNRGAGKTGGGLSLYPVSDTDSTVWGLAYSGSINESFWPQLADGSEPYYHSAVFVGHRRELLLSVYDGYQSDNKLMSRRLLADGQWSDWSIVATTGCNFRGMFAIGGSGSGGGAGGTADDVYGFTKTNDLFKFVWTTPRESTGAADLDTKLTFEPISKLKVFLNCYANSSSLPGFKTPPPPTVPTSPASPNPITTTTGVHPELNDGMIAPAVHDNAVVTNTTHSLDVTDDVTDDDDEDNDGGDNGVNEYNDPSLEDKPLWSPSSEASVSGNGSSGGGGGGGDDVNQMQNNETKLKELIDEINKQPPMDAMVKSADMTPIYLFAIVLLLIIVAIVVAIVIRRKKSARRGVMYMNQSTNDDNDDNNGIADDNLKTVETMPLKSSKTNSNNKTNTNNNIIITNHKRKSQQT